MGGNKLAICKTQTYNNRYQNLDAMRVWPSETTHIGGRIPIRKTRLIPHRSFGGAETTWTGCRSVHPPKRGWLFSGGGPPFQSTFFNASSICGFFGPRKPLSRARNPESGNTEKNRDRAKSKSQLGEVAIPTSHFWRAGGGSFGG